MKNTTLLGLCFAVAGIAVVKNVCGNDLLVSGEAASNGLNVVVHVPDGFANRVEIYTCSNLISGDWRLAAENLRPIGGGHAQWRAETGNRGFFIAGNTDVDSDGDGLSDAREKYVHKTDPHKADSDDDGMPDKWEVQHALNPLDKKDALTDPDGDGFNNLEAYQTSPDLSASDTDGDGFIDFYDLRVNEFDYPVVGEGVFNLVASWRYASFSPDSGFGSWGERLLTLSWSDDFFFPPHPDHQNGEFCTAGSSRLKWIGEALPDDGFFLNRFRDYYWWHLDLFWSSWEPSLHPNFQGLELYEYDRYFSDPDKGAANAVGQAMAEYVATNTSFFSDIHAPTSGSGHIHLLGAHDGDSQRCVIFAVKLSDPAPPLCHIDNSGKMKAVGGELESYGTSAFKFVFNQPVTNRVVKWLTYRYDYDLPAYVDYAIHQCEMTGKESELFSSSSVNMVVPTVDLNGDFDSDGDIDDNDAALRAPANASLPIVAGGQTNETPGSGVIPVKVSASVFAIGMPESVLKIKLSCVEPGERFRLWSTTNVISSATWPIMTVIGGGGGRTELIEDPALLIDTEIKFEHEWPVKNISPLTQGYSYISQYTYAPEFPKTLYLECVSCDANSDGRAKIELIYEYNGEEICSTALPITVIRSKLVPDWNHDRTIDMADQNQNTNNAPFRFWINDDNDSGDISEGDSDVPGQGGGWLGFEAANYKDEVVNGRSDLIDFFPVWLDIKSVLERYPVTNGAVYKLRQADGALKFVYTDLTNTNAGDFLIAETNTYGAACSQNAYEADTIQITSSGVTLDAEFINRIVADTNKGILMMEAVDSSISPLILEIWQGDNKVWETSLALSFSGVEDMYRKINLRSMEYAIQQDSPANYPDELSNGKNMVFLHGFSVNEQAARGWHSEMFKRLYWSGSLAMFHAVTWRGDNSGTIDPLYQENVNNAFLTAPYLAQYVNELSGDKILLAHSLGNMIVSSAIQDYGMSVQKYLMLDAAVASEAYDASLFNDSTNNNPMLHADWREYEPQTWAANFHKLYSAPDVRSRLTWQNRFASVVSNAYNFYNSDDEVFEINPLSVSMMTGVEFDFNIWLPSSEIHGLDRHAWQKQEVFKGRDYLGPSPIGSTDWWGWGFHDSLLGSAGQANGLSTNELRESPVFGHHPDWYNVDNLTTNQVNQMLAMGLPAMSSSAGVGAMNKLNQYGDDRNLDIRTLENGWPRNHPLYGSRWLHSDCKDVAYLYTHKLFKQLVLVTEGGLE